MRPRSRPNFGLGRVFARAGFYIVDDALSREQWECGDKFVRAHWAMLEKVLDRE
jgi:hypothetical protein